MHGFEVRSPSLANWEWQVQDILFARATLLVESETGRERGKEKKTTRTVFSWARGCCVPSKKKFFFGGTQHPLTRHMTKPRPQVGTRRVCWSHHQNTPQFTTTKCDWSLDLSKNTWLNRVPALEKHLDCFKIFGQGRRTNTYWWNEHGISRWMVLSPFSLLRCHNNFSFRFEKSYAGAEGEEIMILRESKRSPEGRRNIEKLIHRWSSSNLSNA